MTQHLFFDGVDLNDFGALPYMGNIYASAARDYTAVSVPGRNGALIIDRGGYGNIARRWNVVFSGPEAAGNAARLRSFLTTRTGYRRIEDTLHPEEFCVGCFHGGLDSAFEENIRYVQYELEFDCKPQRFLKSGEAVTVLTASGVIVNPEPTTARPLIRVYGSGTVTVGDTSFTVASSENAYVDVDSEIEDAYCGAVNCNALVTLSDFPTLPPGETEITPGTGITRVEITPRWWRL